MNDDLPKKQRKRSPYTESTAILVEFTDRGAPLDETRERKGRPERSPSLPPIEEQKPTEEAPPTT
jgi:hypothetical protein